MNPLLLISAPLLLYLQLFGSKRQKEKYTKWVVVLAVVGMAHEQGFINIPFIDIFPPPELPSEVASPVPQQVASPFDPIMVVIAMIIALMIIVAIGIIVTGLKQQHRVWRRTSSELPRPREPGDEREIMDTQNEDAVATEPPHEYEAQVNIDREEDIYARITGDSPEKVEKKPFDRVSAVKEESEHPILSCPKCGAPYDGVECSICGYRVAR